MCVQCLKERTMNRKELSLPEITKKIEDLWVTLAVASNTRNYDLARKTIWTLKYYIGKQQASNEDLTYIHDQPQLI